MKFSLIFRSGETVDPAPLKKVRQKDVDGFTCRYRFKVDWNKVDDVSVAMNDEAEFVLSCDPPRRNLDGKIWPDHGPYPAAGHCYVDSVGGRYVVFQTYKWDSDDNQIQTVVEYAKDNA